MTLYELIEKRKFYLEKLDDIDNILDKIITLGYKYSISYFDTIKRLKFSYIDELNSLDIVLNKAYSTLEVSIDGEKVSLGGLNYKIESLKSKYNFLTHIINNPTEDLINAVEQQIKERDAIYNVYIKYKSIFIKVISGISVDDLNTDNGSED